jgi:hypothetical protein
MGLKDWLVKNTLGVTGYGDALGREVVTNGIALGRTLYLGHGTRPMACDAFVFEDSNHLVAEGFTLYCPDPLHSPPNEDTSPLSLHTRCAGLAFAAFCTFTAASNFMKTDNSSAFARSLGSSTYAALRNLGMSTALLDHYNDLVKASGALKTLNIEKPGTGDLLSMFLREASTQNGGGAVGFQRSGILGFDLIAVPLARETVKLVAAATKKFGW